MTSHMSQKLTALQTLYYATRRLIRRAWANSRKQVLRIFRAIFSVCILCICVALVYVWLRPTRLFVPYTNVANEHDVIRQTIATDADEYLRTHPDDMCISSLELSQTKDRPYFHIILRSNMHRSYDGDFLNVLNPEYIIDPPAAASVRLSSSTSVTTIHQRSSNHPTHHQHDHQHSHTNAFENVGSDVTPMHHVDSHHHPHHPHARVDDAATTSSRMIQAPDVRFTSKLSSVVDTSTGWTRNREESSFCEYVYHRRGGLLSRILQIMWPSFSFHPQTLPIEDVYRKKHVKIRYMDLLTFVPVERTFSHEHAFCIQHYMDVYHNDWKC